MKTKEEVLELLGEPNHTSVLVDCSTWHFPASIEISYFSNSGFNTHWSVATEDMELDILDATESDVMRYAGPYICPLGKIAFGALDDE